MTPADGSDFVSGGPAVATLDCARAIILHGGRTLLLFDGAETSPPRSGLLADCGIEMAWHAECWSLETETGLRWCGLAILERVPGTSAEIVCATGRRRCRLGGPPVLDVAAEPLAHLVRRAGIKGRDVVAYLVRHLLAGTPEPAAADSHRAFIRGFISAVAERDGFIELVATPETGGLFAQGWSMSLAPGVAMLADLADDRAVLEINVAAFDRDDILPPGTGFCFFARSWPGKSATDLDTVFFERDGRLFRLDAIQGDLPRLTGASASTHVAAMLPRISASEAALRAFKRICRPRFPGTDTLSDTTLPVAAAMDSLLRAPDGTMLALGWLLDPLHLVERVLIKSTANLYAPIDADWNALSRPDLNAGFAADPRFAGRIDLQDVMHGFIARAAARPEQTEGAEVYLELVLRDGNCLFRPLEVTPFDTAERLPQLLAALSPAQPEITRMVEDHLAPFLASVRPTSRRRGRGAARPIPLGQAPDGRAVAAIMPFRSLAELQPVFALLADTPEAAALELTLVASRSVAADTLETLGHAFRFYGIAGQIVIASDSETVVERLDTGVAASRGGRVLCWMPSALPKGRDWLSRMLDEADAMPTPGLLSPALTYEDGSIYFGGETGGPMGACGLSGFGARWLPRGAPRPVGSGAAEVALIDRAALDRAGGFSGHLFGESFAHLDLAERLRRHGFGTWCSGAVEFWMLDDHQTAEVGACARITRCVDAVLLARRNHSGTGDGAS